MGQLRQFLQLSAVCDCADLVMREVNSREFNAVLEPLNPSDLVMRQVQSHQYVEVQQVFHSLNLVLVQIQTTKLNHVIKSLDLANAVAFEPDRSHFVIRFQVLDRFETFEVEVELAVGPRRRVLSIEFADGDDVVMGQHGFAILVTG